MGYALRLLAIIMFSTLSESAFAREKDPCNGFLKGLFSSPVIRAPEKPILQANVQELKYQDGIFETSRPGVVVPFMSKLVPDQQTPLGRIAHTFEKKGTYLVFDELGLNALGANGYSAPTRSFRLLHNDELYSGRIIAVKEEMLNTRDFQRILMHEALHDKGHRLRENKIPFQFNSTLLAQPERQLFSNTSLYSRFMSHEEVRTYANNYVFNSIIAHNRKTLKLIQDQMSHLSVDLTKEQKLDQIRLTYDSIIDHEALLIGRTKAIGAIEDHLQNLDYLEAHMAKHRRSLVNDSKSMVRFNVAKDGTPLVVHTEKMRLTLHNVRIKNGSFDLKDVYAELAQMRNTNLVVKSKLEEIGNLIDRSHQKGYFTANEYLDLKNKAGELSKVMRVPSVK